MCLPRAVSAPNHQKAEGAWDYDLVRLQAFGNAVRKIYAVLPHELDTRRCACSQLRLRPATCLPIASQPSTFVL